MKQTLGILAAGALSLGLAACGGGNSVNTKPVPSGNGTSYTQIEVLSRPAVKEVFEKFVDHQTTNAAEPYNDPTLQGEIQTLTDALRPPNTAAGSDYGKALAGILYPNEMVADLSQSGIASYLGVETGGATGGKFGGRALTDDVIDISLGAIFGNTLSALKVQPEDNEENNCISKDNVAMNASQAPSATFPYLHTPH
jgi:hypothetical protein